MTALDEYDRLEAVGVLKRTSDDKGTEVVVTFGEATLTMNALGKDGDTPISHWSLAAVDLISETDKDATYSLNAMAEEVLVIEDATFRRAIGKVLQDRKRSATPSKPSKRLWFWGSVGAIIAAGYVLLPNAVERIAKGMISPERAQLLAAEMVPMIEERTGPACETTDGLTALSILAERLNPNGNTSIWVHDLGDTNVISLPGGRVLINREVIETASDAQITGWTAIGIASVIESPAISELFKDQGMVEGIRFLASGQLPRVRKERAVNRLLEPPSDVGPEILENAAQLLKNADLPLTGLNEINENISATPTETTTSTLMSSEDWAALRAICSG